MKYALQKNYKNYKSQKIIISSKKGCIKQSKPGGGGAHL